MKNPEQLWHEGSDPIQNALIDSIVSAPIHVIATMRSKQEYVLQGMTGAGGRLQEGWHGTATA